MYETLLVKKCMYCKVIIYIQGPATENNMIKPSNTVNGLWGENKDQPKSAVLLIDLIVKCIKTHSAIVLFSNEQVSLLLSIIYQLPLPKFPSYTPEPE